MSTTLSGELHNVDYSDSFQLLRIPRTYSYRLTASGGGKLALKVEQFKVDETKGPEEMWYKIEEKSEIQDGTTLNGMFTVVPEAGPGESQQSIRITFLREFLSHGVDYELFFEPA
jgi:hypothetical protein